MLPTIDLPPTARTSTPTIKRLVREQSWLASLVVMLMLLVPLPTTLHAASFDCAKATHTVEKSVCANDLLSFLDDRLAHQYGKAKLFAKNLEQLKIEQQNWIRETRNKCPDQKCIAQTYLDRIKALSDDQTRDTDLTSQDAYEQLFIACDPARKMVLVGTVAYANASNLFFEERGSEVSYHRWRDLELVAEGQADEEFPPRLGSQTRDIVCGYYHARIEYGYLNSDAGSFQGYESFPAVSLRWKSEILIDSVPLGYWRSAHTELAPLAHRYAKRPCEDGGTQAMIAISPNNDQPPRVYLESECFLASSDLKQRQMMETTR